MKIPFVIKLLILILSLSFQKGFAQEYADFDLETITNNNIHLNEEIIKGPVLLTFWALWCKPCRAEMKHLEKIYNKYKVNGFTIIGINQDTPRSLAKVKAYVSSHNISFPIVTDPNTELFQQFNGQSIPFALLFDKEKNLNYSHIGYLPGDEIELEEKIKSLLGIKN